MILIIPGRTCHSFHLLIFKTFLSASLVHFQMQQPYLSESDYHIMTVTKGLKSDIIYRFFKVSIKIIESTNTRNQVRGRPESSTSGMSIFFKVGVYSFSDGIPEKM